MIRKVLHRMKESGGDINAIARDLNVGRATLDAILEMAVREGYIEKTSIRSSCGACPLHGTCEVEPLECSKTGAYIIIPKGEKYAGF